MARIQMEPLAYQESTALKERNQIVNKVNEVIDQVNLIGEVPPNVGQRLDALDTEVTQNTADVGTAKEDIKSLKMTDLVMNKRIGDNEDKIAVHDTDLEALANESVDRLMLDLKQSKDFRIDIKRGSGEVQTGASIALPFVDTAVLIPGAGDFTFKIDFTMKDGSHVRTGDMVLPSGGVGPDVKISSVEIKQGSDVDKFVVAIVLQDGTSIDSNEYTFPIVDAYDKTTSDERYVRVAAVDQDIGGRKNFVISPYVPDLKPSEIVTGSKRAVNVGQVHEAIVKLDNKIGGIDEQLTTLSGNVTGITDKVTIIDDKVGSNTSAINSIGVEAHIVEGTASDKKAVSITVNGKTSKTEDLPSGGKEWKKIPGGSAIEKFNNFMNHDFKVGDMITCSSDIGSSLNGQPFIVRYASMTCIRATGLIMFGCTGYVEKNYQPYMTVGMKVDKNRRALDVFYIQNNSVSQAPITASNVTTFDTDWLI